MMSFLFQKIEKGSKIKKKKWKTEEKINEFCCFSKLSWNRPVFQNRDRFTGSSGSHRFIPVFTLFSAVLQTNGSVLLSGPVLCPVSGPTGWTGRSGLVFTTLSATLEVPINKQVLSLYQFLLVSQHQVSDSD
jgi:hypothetical protein